MYIQIHHLYVLVFGADRQSYESILPNEAFIHVQDYLEGPEKLANRLKFLDQVLKSYGFLKCSIIIENCTSSSFSGH